jgi:peroxiredoxin
LVEVRNLLSILLCAAALCAADGPKRAPGFALPDSKMNVHDLYDYRGKPVIVEFLQTSCPHCAAFAEVLAKVQQKYGDKVAILGVANPPDTQATVAKYIEGHKITYPILFDSGQAAFSYVRKMHFELPQVFIVDAQGMIYKHFENDAMSKDIFEGDGLMWELDRMLGTGVQPGKKK